VSLAKNLTLLWHESSIDFASIMVALGKWKENSGSFPPSAGLDNIATIKFNRKAEHKQTPQPFSRMMYELREFCCFDPRDRVYGLLGLGSLGT
jgi:hypothetical protein